MNVNLNSSLHGEYTIYNEQMEEIASTKNLITDWGMRRFVGDRSEGGPECTTSEGPQRAFCTNFSNLFVGVSSTPVSTTDFKLGMRVTPLSVETIPSQTGTSWQTAQDGDLVIIYTHTQKLTFASNLPSSIVIREVGANWTTIEGQNNRYGIFSRAVLPSSGNNSFVTINANLSRKQVIFLKYVLYFKTNCNKILTSMPHLTGTGATQFPANKTNVRRFPLFTMNSLAQPVEILNIDGRGADHVTHDSKNEYVQPLFENMALDNDRAVGTAWTNTASTPTTPGVTVGDTLTWQSNLLGTSTGIFSARKIWWLQLYTQNFINPNDTEQLINGGMDPQNRFEDFYSTTTLDFNNSRSLYNVRSTFFNNGTIFNSQVALDINANPLVLHTGRVPHDYTELTRNGNTWNRKIQFFYTPNLMKQGVTVFKLYPATLGNWSDVVHSSYDYPGSVYMDATGYHDYGVVTALSAAYNPNTTHYLGFEYNFTFTRQVSSYTQLGNTFSTQGLPTPQRYYDPNNINSYNPTPSLSATLTNIGTLSADSTTHGRIFGANQIYQTEGAHKVFNFATNTPDATVPALSNDGFSYAGDSAQRIVFPPFDFTNQPITVNIWYRHNITQNFVQLFGNTKLLRENPQGFSCQIYGTSMLFYQFFNPNRSGSSPWVFVDNADSDALHSSSGLFTSSNRWEMLTFVYQPKNKQVYFYFSGSLVTSFQTDQRSTFTRYSTTTPNPSSGQVRILGSLGSSDINYSTIPRGTLGEVKVLLNYIPNPTTIRNEYNNTRARYGV